MNTKHLFVALGTVGLLASVVRAETIRLRVDVPAPQVHSDGQGYAHVRIEGYLNLGRPGEPSLPSRTVPVLLPPGHQVVSVTVRPTDTLSLQGRHLVFPLQRRYPPSHRGLRPFTGPDPAVYQSPAAYPRQIGEAGKSQSKRGFSVLPVLVRPVVYAPRSGRLSCARALVIFVQTTFRKDRMPIRLRGFDRDFSALRSLVANPGLLSAYPRPLHPRNGGDQFRYVVVTSQALLACQGEYTLQTLTAEKNTRGISTRIQTMEEIRSGYQGTDDAERVRNFIRDMYENHGSDYVLLAGDADLEVVGGETEPVIVPVRGLWGDIEYGGVEENLPSDIYYACLDGTYNADLDDVYGEETDEVDLLAEVIVGRAPVDSCSEVQNFVRKTLTYRENREPHLKSVWLAGEWCAPEIYGADDLEPLRTGGWNHGRFMAGFADNPFFEVSTLYDAGTCEKDCWGLEEIMNVMNGGVHILHHLGHSYTNYNMRVTCDDIDAGLSNTRYFFQYTGGCYPGSFDNRFDPLFEDGEVSLQDSFAEHLVLGEHGAFAAIMFTRYGVGSTLAGLFWNAAFGRGMKELGAMHTYSREEAAGWISDRAIRWEVYSLNLFGDPEASLHMSDSTQPVLGVPRTPLLFVAVEGAEKPEGQQLVIRNDGEESLAWSTASDQSWLTVSPSSGLAPAEVTVSADTTGLPAGQHQAALTVIAAGAAGSPQTVDVHVLVDDVPDLDVPHTLASPVVDGAISKDEYKDAAFLEVGFVAPGFSTARLIHDDRKLYVALLLLDDKDADAGDALNIYLDNNNDDHWPPEPGDEGVYYLAGDGSIYFIPVFDAGAGPQHGDSEEGPPGVEAAFGLETGMRVIEVSFDLTQGRLQTRAGESAGMGLLYWDQTGDEYDLVAAWPSIMASIGGTHCKFLGNIELGREADRIFVRPEELLFAATAGGSPSDPEQLVIDATTENEQDFTIVTSEQWILPSQSDGTTPAAIEVRADPAVLEAGVHNGKITVIAPGAKNSPVEVPVVFDVAERLPAFSIEPPSLSFGMIAGDPLPEAQRIQINNTGGGELNWTAVVSGEWIELSAPSGSAPASLTVTPVDADLPAGRYSAAIIFTAPGADGAQVNVILQVEASDASGCATLPPSGTILPALLMAFFLLFRRSTLLRKSVSHRTKD